MSKTWYNVESYKSDGLGLNTSKKKNNTYTSIIQKYKWEKINWMRFNREKLSVFHKVICLWEYKFYRFYN